jgi:hypothetical protein
MATEPWPCWACKWRTGPDWTETYSCSYPVEHAAAPIWAIWRLKNAPMVHGRYIGTEKQLRGESDNDRPECRVMERA